MSIVRKRAYTSTERAMIIDLALKAGWKLLKEERVSDKQTDLIFETRPEDDDGRDS